MELLQKLTLYDLLGYTLPGSALILILQYDCILQQEYGEGFPYLMYFVYVLILGYLLGIMISEIMRQILDIIFDEKKVWKKVCSKYAVTSEKIKDALIAANLTDSSEDENKVSKYKSQMYSDIQVDPAYSRIHNYASAELLYKNMIFVTIVCSVAGIIQNTPFLFGVGVVGIICFGMRWKRFYEKKVGYMLCWFIKKYSR